MTSVLRHDVLLSSHLMPMTGDVKFGFTDLDHTGWLLCDGRTVNVSDFPKLHRIIGYAYGGSGATFRLPDMRGRVPGAVNQASNRNNTLSVRNKNDAVGTETHTLTIAEMPAHKHGDADVSGNTNGNGNTTLAGQHTHTATDTGHTHTYVKSNDSNSLVLSGATGDTVNDDTVPNTNTGIGNANIVVAGVADHSHTIKNTGGGESHNNMQPTLFIGNMFIYSSKFHYGTQRGKFPGHGI